MSTGFVGGEKDSGGLILVFFKVMKIVGYGMGVLNTTDFVFAEFRAKVVMFLVPLSCLRMV